MAHEIGHVLDNKYKLSDRPSSALLNEMVERPETSFRVVGERTTDDGKIIEKQLKTNRNPFIKSQNSLNQYSAEKQAKEIFADAFATAFTNDNNASKAQRTNNDLIKSIVIKEINTPYEEAMKNVVNRPDVPNLTPNQVAERLESEKIAKQLGLTQEDTPKTPITQEDLNKRYLAVDNVKEARLGSVREIREARRAARGVVSQAQDILPGLLPTRPQTPLFPPFSPSGQIGDFPLRTGAGPLNFGPEVPPSSSNFYNPENLGIAPLQQDIS